MTRHRTLHMLCVLLVACGSGREQGAKPANLTDSARTASASREHRPESDRVTLTEAAYQTAQIQIALVESSQPSAVAAPLEVPGEVEVDPHRLALVSPRIDGRVERLNVVEGDRVSEGQVVAQLYSPAYVTAQSDYLQAVRRAQALAATADSQGAAALAQAAGRRLRLLGVTDAELRRLGGEGEPKPFLDVLAPLGGSVVEAHAVAGQAIQSGAPIYKLADLSSVDVVARVPESALPSVRVGQGATILVAAYPDARFAGRLERLHDDIDTQTRTLHAVVHVANTARTLRPGMFATVLLNTAPTRRLGAAVVLTIPEQAVVSDGEVRFVFVEVAPRTYERREVKLASLTPTGSSRPVTGRVAVLEGLSAGDRVVTHGGFTLKSELAKSAFAEDER